jgi:hypothetical protein
MMFLDNTVKSGKGIIEKSAQLIPVTQFCAPFIGDLVIYAAS